MGNKILMPSRDEMRELFEKKFSGENAKFLPKARGWRMLVMIPQPKTQTAGGIELPDDYVQKEAVASPIGLVIEKGPLCYQDKKKFPDGAHWCEEGDLIFFRSYAGTRLVIQDIEFRWISDESVEGVVEDPRGIERI